MRRVTTILTVVTALWLCIADSLYAQDRDYAAVAQGRATASGAATSVPVSDSEIIGKLETPTGAVFHFKVKDGGMLRVVDEQAGVTHGFVAHRQEGEPGTVLFHQYLIELHPSGGGEVLRSLDRSFSTSLSQKALTDEGYELELLEIGNDKAVPFPTTLFPRAPEPQPLCCIYCTGYSVCGCAISACGASCCSGSCCGGGDGDPNPDTKGP
jgi:hypothetical protein